MKRLGFLICGSSAVLTLTAGAAVLGRPPGADPFGAALRPVLAWGPCIPLLFLAAFVLAGLRPLSGMAGRGLAVLIIGAAMLWPVLALAQDAAASPTGVNLGALFGDVRGTIETLLGVVISAIVGLLCFTVKKNTGLSIDGKMRDTLQSALTNGVHAGLDAVQHLADGHTIDVKSRVIAEGIAYVRRFAPVAVKHFKLGDDDLAEMLRAKLAALQPAETKSVSKVAGA